MSTDITDRSQELAVKSAASVSGPGQQGTQQVSDVQVTSAKIREEEQVAAGQADQAATSAMQQRIEDVVVCQPSTNINRWANDAAHDLDSSTHEVSWHRLDQAKGDD
jgi:hypothetical protein